MDKEKITKLRKRDSMFEKYGEPISLEELAIFVVNVSNDELPKKQHITGGISWDINYGYVYNTFESPINGVVNYYSEPELPTSYDGFFGTIWIRATYDTKLPISRRIENSFTYTGVGGYGCYGGPWSDLERDLISNKNLDFCKEYFSIYSWDYRFFIEDFPLLFKKIEEEKIISIMQGEKIFCKNNKFFWQNEEVTKQDELILKDFRI